VTRNGATVHSCGQVSRMNTGVCRTGPVAMESEIGFYDPAQLETLVNALRHALEAAVMLSEGFENNAATARELIAVRLAVARVVGATMNLQPRKVV
jgi:hypothetical protein